MFNKIKLYIFSLFVIFCSVVFFYFTGCCSKGSGGSGFVAGNVGGHQPEPKLFDVKVNEDGSITKTLAPSGRLSIEAPKNTLNKDVVVHMVENQAIGNESDIYSVGKYIYAIKPDREDTEDTGIKVSSIAKRDVKMQTNPIILTFSDDERLTGAENYFIGIKEIGGKDWQFVNVYSATNLQINSNGPKGSFEFKLYKDNVLVALFADFNKNLEDRPKVLSMVASMPSNVIEILDGRYNEDAVIKLKFIGDNLSSLRADDYRIRLHYANTDSKQVNIRIDGKTANYTSGTSTNKYEAFGELYAHYYEFIPTTASYSAGVTPELSFTVNFKKFPVGDFSSNFVVEVSNATDKAVPFYLSDSLSFETKDGKEQEQEPEPEPEPSVATTTVMFSLASDSTDIFDTAKNLYYLNPTFTVTASPSYEFTDDAKSIIASSVILVEMNSVVRANTASSTETTEQTFEADDELLKTEWNEKGLIIGFKQRLATYTQYVISMNDINVLEGANIEPFSPFTFRTAGALEVKIASDSNNLIDLENNLYHCRPIFTINPGFNPNDSEKAAIASAVSVIGAEDGIVTKTWNNNILSIGFSRNLAADTEYTVSMSEPAGMKRLCLKPFQPLKFKTTGEFYIALVPDADNVFDTENSLYRCRPSFTITPSIDLKDEDQAKIASAVRVVGVEEGSIQKTWASGSLTISFTQDIGQNGEFTLSISDLPEIEGRNFITFQPFVFKTIGALAIALSADNDNVYVPANQLYNCNPGFTITPSIPLNEEDRAKIAEAVSVSNVGANQITKNWDNDGKLIIGFSQNLAPATEYRLSMSDVTSINGVTVNGFEPLVFNTVGNLEFTLTPNTNNVYATMESKYRCNPGFTITPSFVLNEEDRAKIANAVTINNNASLIKNWEGNNLKVSLNQNLATNTAYMLSMSAINDIKGINVVPFAALNFTTLGALSFTVTPDDDNVYTTVSPKYQCRPGFTVTPSFALTDEDKAKIADAVIISNVGNIASKTWDANNLRISMTENLAADTAYSLSMAAVNNIDGIAVTPFAAVDFTTIGTLNFTVTPDDDNLFDIPNSLTHCKPGFTVTPAFALNDVDKAKILEAVTVVDVASSSVVKEWDNEGKLLVSFNTKLASGTDYSLNMAAVDDIKGVRVTAFDPQPFRTMNAINVTLDSEDSNIIDVPNNLYHCRPQFTITACFDADDDAKAIIASAVSVIGADENNITKTWVNDNLVVGFTSNLTTNTEYTISLGDIEESFDRLAFNIFQPLNFRTTDDSYIALIPDEENVFVSTPTELYHCRPTFTIAPSVALGDSDRATIAAAVHVSGVADGNLTMNWDASGSLILGFTQNLAHNTEYTVSIDSVGEIAGVNLVLFQPFTFTTVPVLNFVLTADTGNVYEAVPSLYRCNPAFTITTNCNLSDATKAIIADAISVSNSAVTLKNWEGNNLRVTFSSALEPNSAHTISMAAVNSITGVTVNTFASQSFTTVPVLTFTLNSPDSNVFISTPTELYHCRPVFTVTPSFNLTDDDKAIIAGAVTINNSANLMTKNWNGNVLEISFSSDLPNSTDYTLSMDAVTSISGVSVTPFTAKSFTTIEGLVISIASDSGDLFTIENGVGLYQTLPTFTVTSNMALSATDQTTIANAISVSNIDDPYKVTKSWANATTLNISFTENLSLNSNYSITMAAVNNISGVTVTGFSPMNFRTMNALTFTATPDANNVYEAMSPKYHCRPAFTIRPNYSLSGLSVASKTVLLNAISVSNSSGLIKAWDDDNIRLTFSSNLSSGNHTLSMAAVNGFTGITVTPFADFGFTVLDTLTFAIATGSTDVYEAMSPQYRLNPTFTITPSFTLNAADKTNIENAVSVVNSNVASKVWNGNNLVVTFSQNLTPNTNYTLRMGNVSGMDNLSISAFSDYAFTTVPQLSFNITSANTNVFYNSKFHCNPTFTITPSFNLNSGDKSIIEEAVSVSGVSSNNLSKSWSGNNLLLGFNQYIATSTDYTISMATINNLTGVNVTSLSDYDFSTIPDLIVSIATSSTTLVKKANSSTNVLEVNGKTYCYCSGSSFNISTNMTLNSSNKAKIYDAISLSGIDSSLVNKAWNGEKVVISFNSELTASTSFSIQMAAIDDINGVTVRPFSIYNCKTFFHTGKGKSADPFTIYTPAQLACLDLYPGEAYYYKQMEDLDLSAYDNWKPIGSSTTGLVFKGSYNGNNKKISNLTMNYSDVNRIGLFASTYSSCVFSNLTLDNFNIIGKTSLGGLVGYSDYSTFSNINITNITASGSSYIGGICGFNYGSKFSDIYANNINVTGNEYVGGLVGANNPGSNCTNVNVSYVKASGTSYIGGLFGDASNYGKYIDITCDNIEVISNKMAGGIASSLYSATIENITITNSLIKSITSSSGGIASSIRNSNSCDNVLCDNITVLGYYVGGVANKFENTPKNNCRVLNSKIIGDVSAGGLASEIEDKSNYSRSEITKNCIVRNTEIESVDKSTRSSGGFCYSASLINHADSIIDNCFVYDCKVISRTYPNGGFASTLSGNITNCGVENTSIVYEGKNFNGTGGFVGTRSRGNVISCYVSSITMDVTSDVAGGFIGYNNGGNIESCYVENAKINFNNRDYYEGGFGGFIGNLANGNINSCFVSNTNIKSRNSLDYYGNTSFGRGSGCFIGNIGLFRGSNNTIGSCQISNCYVIGSTIDGIKRVGGFLGTSGYQVTATIDKCFVKNTYVKGYDNSIGGFAGCLASATMDSCYITGCSIVTDVDVPSVAGLVGSNTGDISNCYMYNSTLTGKAGYGALIGANGSGARTPVISDCFVSQDHDILINTNYKDAPENCYYNVNDLSTFNGETWSDGAWSNYDTSVFPPKLTELPEP